MIKSLFEKIEPLEKRYQNSMKIFQSYFTRVGIEDTLEVLNEDENDITYEKIESDLLYLDENTDESIIKSYSDCIENMIIKFHYAETIDHEKQERLVNSLLIEWGYLIMKPITSPTLCSMIHRDSFKVLECSKTRKLFVTLSSFCSKAFIPCWI